MCYGDGNPNLIAVLMTICRSDRLIVSRKGQHQIRHVLSLLPAEKHRYKQMVAMKNSARCFFFFLSNVCNESLIMNSIEDFIHR